MSGCKAWDKDCPRDSEASAGKPQGHYSTYSSLDPQDDLDVPEKDGREYRQRHIRNSRDCWNHHVSTLDVHRVGLSNSQPCMMPIPLIAPSDQQ